MFFLFINRYSVFLYISIELGIKTLALKKIIWFVLSTLWNHSFCHVLVCVTYMEAIYLEKYYSNNILVRSSDMKIVLFVKAIQCTDIL